MDDGTDHLPRVYQAGCRGRRYDRAPAGWGVEALEDPWPPGALEPPLPPLPGDGGEPDIPERPERSTAP